jgi:ATP-binding cassette subfamily B protein
MSVFTVAFILWYGGLSVLKLELTLGALLAYLYYVRMLFRPIMELAERYNIFQSATAASENLYDLVNVKPEQKEGIVSEHVRGKLEFEHVWFSYNGRDWVLKDVSFTIEPGETVALVGLTGSGKTTIVNLILRFYDADRGRILFDGRDIRELSPEFLRRNISAVFQDLFLFGKNISDEESDEFTKAIKIDRITANGNTISSGEKQLVSLGQAFSKDAGFLILDEATSNIDARIEGNIQKALRNEARDQTTLIIAHRLSNVRHADRIMVIHKGEISEIGTHTGLLEKKGIYFNLYKLQNEIHRFSLLTD